MKKTFLIASLLLLSCVMAGAQGLKRVYDETIDPLEQIDQALDRARSEGKFVVAQVGGNWCPWCLRFADFITNDPDIASLVADNFVYIHVSYTPKKDAGDERARQMLRRLGNPGRFGYPVLVVLDAAGNVLHIQDSSFLEQEKSYDAKKVLRFFKNWTPAAVNP